MAAIKMLTLANAYLSLIFQDITAIIRSSPHPCYLE